MPVRYTDLDFSTSGAHDFVVRKRTPTIVQLLSIMLVSLALAAGLAFSSTNPPITLAISALILTSVGWYVSLSLQRYNDILLATEFQNALFASALGLNNKFCMIIKQDGNIIYLDRAFQDMFPEFLRQSRRSIDALLEYGRVSREDSERVFSAIQRGVYEKVVFNVRGGTGALQKIVMSVEPILRPSGFIMLRGREFVENRAVNAGAGAAETVLSKSTVTLFSHVMDSMNMGVYMTGPTGGIVYANPVLEQWLEFGENDIAANNLTLHDIVHITGHRPDTFEPTDFEGEVMLHKKTGGLLRCFINQKVIRSEQNKIVGCTALLHPFGVQEQARPIEQAPPPPVSTFTSPDVKKKLW